MRFLRLSQPSIHLPLSVYLSVIKIPRPFFKRFSFSAKKSSVAYKTLPPKRSAPKSVICANAGAILPKRDTLDRRIVNETITGTASTHSTNPTSTYYNKGNIGIIDTQDSIGGWPHYDTTAIAPIDTDHDGMPDFWENMKGLDTSNPNDRNDTLPNGYTRLEEYLNSIPVANPLPLHIVSFTVQKQNNTNVLTWAIENNVEQVNFVIEKSYDATRFKDIGSLFSSNQKEYNFITNHESK